MLRSGGEARVVLWLLYGRTFWGKSRSRSNSSPPWTERLAWRKSIERSAWVKVEEMMRSLGLEEDGYAQEIGGLLLGKGTVVYVENEERMRMLWLARYY